MEHKKETSITIGQVKLPAKIKKLISIPTPEMFIKTRPIRGNKTANYVEGGYVVARLNQAFSPIGWDFEVVEEKIEAKEVVVRGRLLIKDPIHNFQVGKTQYGTKERYAGVPLGDTLKGAATDCLKKCASMFGIALDVYWPDLDEEALLQPVIGGKKGGKKVFIEAKVIPEGKKDTISRTALLEMTKAKIDEEEDLVILEQMKNKIKNANAKLYTMDQKTALVKIIQGKINKIIG
jgi:hypothetical protein